MATVFLDVAGDTQGIPITIGRSRMQRLAKHWHYVLRSRRRWIDDDALRETIETRAADHLAAIGVGKDFLEALAATDVVQVSIPFGPTSPERDSGWEARLVPWEYLLTAASGKYRSGPLVVVRHLKTDRVPEPLPNETLHATFVDSAPGRLRGKYNFDIERKALRVHLAESAEWDDLSNPTLAIIKDSMAARPPEQSPALIHVSGIDSFLGTRLLAEMDKSAPGEIELREISDGMFLRNEDWDETLVESRALAQALTSAQRKPALVSFNLYNSSARSAAFAVAEGAGAALGFQDFLDDLVAEIFFANFYLNWRRSGFHTLDAFKKTLSGLKRYADKMRGSSIVLWSSKSLVGVPGTAAEKPRRAKAKGQKAAQLAGLVRHGCTAADMDHEILPIHALNYSILHNRQPIFETFSIYKFHPGELSDLRVQVELQIGNERFGYQSTFPMEDHVLDLSREIAIGLTSEMARSLQECVQTTLFVRVSLGDAPFLSKTYPVTLLPTDEWRDDDVNGIWLPSFVLPRDQTVLEVIVAAQRYLMALRDDAFAGFDGYQAVDQSADSTDNLDAQVRAIWYALVHDYRLNYINPPPVFTSVSQRLRTPTDVLRGGRGTCIDLALLIAACLEFIGIKPVIFLLDGHAFPGYWSSETIREQFLVGPNPLPLMEAPDNPTPLPSEEEDVESGATETFAQLFSWELDSSRYSEVFRAVQNGDIVPLESTMLTTGGGFWEAIDQAIENLRNPDDFHSMLDIGLARVNHVTPLPLASLPNQARGKP